MSTNPSLRCFNLNHRFWTKFHNHASFLSCFGLETLLDRCIFISWFRRDDFFTGESNIMDRGQFITSFSHSFLLHKMLIDGLELDCDGTHSLHWWASDVMQHFLQSVLMKNKLIYILDGWRMSTFSVNLSFEWTTPLRCHLRWHAVRQFTRFCSRAPKTQTIRHISLGKFHYDCVGLFVCISIP